MAEFEELPGWARASQRWRSRGSSSGSRCADPVRQVKRSPLRIFRRRLQAVFGNDPELVAHEAIADRSATRLAGLAADGF